MASDGEPETFLALPAGSSSGKKKRTPTPRYNLRTKHALALWEYRQPVPCIGSVQPNGWVLSAERIPSLRTGASSPANRRCLQEQPDVRLRPLLVRLHQSRVTPPPCVVGTFHIGG